MKRDAISVVNSGEKRKFAKNGNRTHAHFRELPLEGNTLTTRPSWHDIESSFRIVYIGGIAN